MSDQSDNGTNESNDNSAAAQTEQGVPPQLRIERIFLKDASFESPSAPEVFLRQWRPELKLDINTQANRISETQHQVILTITVTAQLEGDMVGFIVEVQQGGIFHIEGVEEKPTRADYRHSLPHNVIPLLARICRRFGCEGWLPTIATCPSKFRSVVCASDAATSGTKSGRCRGCH